jgi:hypothetical protein
MWFAMDSGGPPVALRRAGGRRPVVGRNLQTARPVFKHAASNRRRAATVSGGRTTAFGKGSRRLNATSEPGTRGTIHWPARKVRRPAEASVPPHGDLGYRPGVAWRSAASRRRNIRVTLAFWALNVLLLTGHLFEHGWTALTHL